MIKVMTIVGTRPEIIRLSRVISKLDEFCDHILIHTGQNYDKQLNDIFFNELRIRQPNSYLNAAGNSPIESIANILLAIDKVLDMHNPDAVLILGDTNSSLTAIAAKRKKIPIFHMEAGNRCFDLRVPEEINRKIVDHIADINLTYSSIARDYLINEGLSPDQVIKTGSPMKEILDFYDTNIQESSILDTLKLAPQDYFLVSAHREENVDSNIKLQKLIVIINLISKKYKKKVIISTHPRTRNRLKKIEYEASDSVHFMEPFGFFDYIKLQKDAKCVLSDSGTITEESSILNFPALNIREAHERPEGFEEASVMMVGFDEDLIIQGLEILAKQPRDENRLLKIVDDYNIDNVSDKVLRIILSYTNFINARVWKK